MQIYGKATERFDPTKRGGRYKSDFIWNEKWQETMKRDEDLDRKRREYVEKEKQGLQQMTASTSVQQPGAISFGLLAQLDNMDVDLSAALMPRKVDPAPPTLKPKTIPTAAAAASVPIPRLNAEKLKRTSRITKPKSVISEKDEDEEERIRVVTAEREVGGLLYPACGMNLIHDKSSSSGFRKEKVRLPNLDAGPHGTRGPLHARALRRKRICQLHGGSSWWTDLFEVAR